VLGSLGVRLAGADPIAELFTQQPEALEQRVADLSATPLAAVAMTWAARLRSPAFSKSSEAVPMA
jgi:hypothetical protein